jgi:hypothetical protein
MAIYTQRKAVLGDIRSSRLNLDDLISLIINILQGR